MNETLSEDFLNENTVYSIETWQNIKTDAFYALALVKQPNKDNKDALIVAGSDTFVLDTYKHVDNPEIVKTDVIAEWKGVENMPIWRDFFTHFVTEIKATYFNEQAFEALGLKLFTEDNKEESEQ